MSENMDDTVQLLEEHVRVFGLNNALLRSFPVRARHRARALLRLLPLRVTVGLMGATLALLLMWLAPRLVGAWRVRAGAGPPASAFDAAAGAHCAAPTGDEL